MDLSLPGMDGWEATRRLKKDARSRSDIPVIALTGHALAGHPRRARAKPAATRFVTKPCVPADLGQEIRRVLRGSRARAGRR